MTLTNVRSELSVKTGNLLLSNDSHQHIFGTIEQGPRSYFERGGGITSDSNWGRG